MMRVTGFLLGTVLMLAVFALALSAGIARPPVQLAINSAADASAADAPTRDTATIATADVSVEDTVDSVAPPAADTASLDEESRLEVKGSGLEVNDKGLELDPQSWNQSIAAWKAADRRDAREVSRYLVWSPFRSEWAAQGFAQRLTVATEVPVEVVNEGPGNYQVVFSYRDDGERQAMVERIETVTGLELE